MNAVNESVRRIADLATQFVALCVGLTALVLLVALVLVRAA